MQAVVIRQELQRSQKIMCRDLPQEIHDLEQANDAERGARPWISNRGGPPADAHKLLPVGDIAIALAKIDADVVDARHVNDNEMSMGRD